MLYECCNLCVVFLKEKNQLIAEKIKLVEQCESALKSILKLTALQDALILANGILNNELTPTIQNIYLAQATTAQLRAEKRNL